VLRENSKRLFWVLWNSERTKTRRRIIDAYLQCRTGGNRVTSKTTKRTILYSTSKHKYLVGAKQQSESVFSAWKRSEQSMIEDQRKLDQIYGDKTFEVVKEFVYLGSLVTPNNDVSLEIQKRIQTDASSDCANNCSRGVFHVQQNSSSTRLLYGSETWVLTKRQENQPRCSERYVARVSSTSWRRIDCATLDTWSEDPKTYHRRLFL
jgi:hypothetical protein